MGWVGRSERESISLSPEGCFAFMAKNELIPGNPGTQLYKKKNASRVGATRLYYSLVVEI